MADWLLRRCKFAIPLITLLFLGCDDRDQATLSNVDSKSNAPAVNNEELELVIEKQDIADTPIENYRGEFPYKAVYRAGEVFLVLKSNPRAPFGPFRRTTNTRGRYLFVPENRPNAFSSAKQLYLDSASQTWWYSDNYLTMRAVPVDTSDVKFSQ